MLVAVFALSTIASLTVAKDPFHSWWTKVSEDPWAKARDLSSIFFRDVGVPQSEEDMTVTRMTDHVNISGEVVFEGSPNLEDNFHVIVEVGEAWRQSHPYEGDTFGLLRTKTREPIYLYDMVTGVSNTSAGFYSIFPDFASLIHQDERTVMIVHMENFPGGTYLLELDQDTATGKLTLTKSTFMDWSKYGGMWNPCAGTLSPWNTHLGAEEYGPDYLGFASISGFPTCNEDWCSWSDPARSFADVMRYHNVYPIANQTGGFAAYNKTMHELTHPYMFGYVFEAGLLSNGSSFGIKRMAMGRKSGELAFIMPDRKTAYMTDDGTNTFLSVFVADVAEDLSAGHLFCARVAQTSHERGGQFDIEWVDMGHATESDVFAAVFESATRPSFYELFEEASPMNRTFPATCPEGFRSTHGGEGLQCLKLKPGKEILASRLESRRYASYLGCATEWNKMEGFSYSADSGKSYIAMTAIEKGMEDRKKKGSPTDDYDAGTENQIRLPYNPCGCVYEMVMDESNWMATSMSGMICGEVDPLNADLCADSNIANPDNLAAIHGHGALLIGEDSYRKANNMLWKYDLETGSLQERIASTPLGAEVSSPYFYPDVAGWSYVILIAQHPEIPEVMPLGGFRRAQLGYTTWERHCGTAYPDWSMPGDGSHNTCKRGDLNQKNALVSKTIRFKSPLVMCQVVLAFLCLFEFTGLLT